MRLWFLLLGMVFRGLTWADPLDVTDRLLLANAVKQLATLKEQLSTLEKTYNNAKSQLMALEKLENLNSGHYQLGSLHNSLADLKDRQWSYDSWDAALLNVAGGNSKRYEELARAYNQAHPIPDEERFKAGSSLSQLNLYKQSLAVNRVVTVEGSYMYSEINRHLKAVHDLSMEIEKASSTKAIMDLNARLLTEIAYLQTQNLKVQTLVSQQLAQNSANDLMQDDLSTRFNQLPAP